jgi:peptidoglycan/LPS O-acetylase OafA/YrhL
MQLPLARLDYIDGLRAIAILSVVGFHVGLPGFSGGFTGVDVFFVLSGFLIIGQIWTDLESRSFSLWEFYGRRALRILPPYLIVLAACAALGSGVLTGVEELKAFGVELKASATMTINHLFLRQQGYFDSSADLKPLLNMWSLAVEEQFYLLFQQHSACSDGR